MNGMNRVDRDFRAARQRIQRLVFEGKHDDAADAMKRWNRRICSQAINAPGDEFDRMTARTFRLDDVGPMIRKLILRENLQHDA